MYVSTCTRTRTHTHKPGFIFCKLLLQTRDFSLTLLSIEILFAFMYHSTSCHLVTDKRKLLFAPCYSACSACPKQENGNTSIQSEKLGDKGTRGSGPTNVQSHSAASAHGARGPMVFFEILDCFWPMLAHSFVKMRSRLAACGLGPFEPSGWFLVQSWGQNSGAGLRILVIVLFWLGRKSFRLDTSPRGQVRG